MTLLLLAGVLVSWIIGSFPTAFLVGRSHGIDLRTVGSGNLGATNVLRTIGWKAALLVYAVDTLKGALPVVLLPRIVQSLGGAAPLPQWGIVFGLAAIVGHVRPVFLRGKGGGKGVATASGVFLALSPIPALVAVIVFVFVAALSRYISLASLAGAIALVITAATTEGLNSPVSYVALPVAAFVFWTHRDNIKRLLAGTERRIGGTKENVSVKPVGEE